MTSNTMDPNIRPHTTHYAYGERMQEYKEKTVGCCCTGHACQVDAGQYWDDKPSEAPLQLEDFEGEPNPRAALRANARNSFLDMHSALTDGISALAGSYHEIADTLELPQDPAVASALSDLAVAAQRVVDKIEDQLNKQMMQEQKEAAK